MAIGTLRRLPHFLMARSLMGLRRQMLINNARDGMEYRYFDIQQDQSGRWVAFFNKIIKKVEVEKELAVALPNGGKK